MRKCFVYMCSVLEVNFCWSPTLHVFPQNSPKLNKIPSYLWVLKKALPFDSFKLFFINNLNGSHQCLFRSMANGYVVFFSLVFRVMQITENKGSSTTRVIIFFLLQSICLPPGPSQHYLFYGWQKISWFLTVAFSTTLNTDVLIIHSDAWHFSSLRLWQVSLNNSFTTTAIIITRGM